MFLDLGAWKKSWMEVYRKSEDWQKWVQNGKLQLSEKVCVRYCLLYSLTRRLVYLTLSVSGHPDGQELTIWDSNESEFASGLEHQRIFR